MALKERLGTVVSDKMDKTVVVAVENRFPHSMYQKIVSRTSRYDFNLDSRLNSYQLQNKYIFAVMYVRFVMKGSCDTFWLSLPLIAIPFTMINGMNWFIKESKLIDGIGVELELNRAKQP